MAGMIGLGRTLSHFAALEVNNRMTPPTGASTLNPFN